MQDRHVVAAIRQKQEGDEREMWPVRVNEALRLLTWKVETLEARVAKLEAPLG